jgi:hypothetical protein
MKRLSFSASGSVGLFALSILFFSALSSCKKDPVTPVVVTTDKPIAATDKVDGKTFADLAAESMKLLLNISGDKSPYESDKTGALQPVGKPFGNVVFIYPSSDSSVSKRIITIKKGQFIFTNFSNVTAWYTKGDTCDKTFVPKAGQSDLAFLQEALGDYLDDSGNITAEYDGKKMYDTPSSQRVKTAIFNALIHPDYNVGNCDWRPKTSICYADGYYIAIEPSAGTHTLKMYGKGKNFAVVPLTYTIKVE